jgi:hypothetical protein
MPKLPQKSKKSKKVSQSDNQDNGAKENCLGLFDHVRQISQVRNPHYFDTLTDGDKKTFNHFMVLKALSMNPEYLEDTAFLFKYFDTIPSNRLYQFLIMVLPPQRTFHPWIKGKKKDRYKSEVLQMVASKFEISTTQAIDCAHILEFRGELRELCRGYGLTDKELDNLLNTKE